MDYSVIGQAGITGIEAARIVGVSRVMLWKYQARRAQPRPDIQARLEALLGLLHERVASKHLPKHELAFSPRMSAEAQERRDAMLIGLRRLVDQHVGKNAANA